MDLIKSTSLKSVTLCSMERKHHKIARFLVFIQGTVNNMVHAKTPATPLKVQFTVSSNVLTIESIMVY